MADRTKLELVQYSYEQVLDATKHQDDKIGRLLTTIAFLTASSLAVAGLGGARALSATFALGPVRNGQATGAVPAAFICLVAFLIGVVLTVIQLIGSLSTPLRLPGLDPARSHPTVVSRPSTLYFHEIEKSTPDEWERTWSRRPSALEKERFDSLVRETHNLALRTSFKYNRTGEATAVLTWALIALTLTIAFSAIALIGAEGPVPGAPTDPIHVVLTAGGANFIGGLVAALTLVWSVARARHALLAREYDELGHLRSRARVQTAVALGSSVTLYWVLGAPYWFGPDSIWIYQGLAGLCALFTATCMAWSTWDQREPASGEQTVKRFTYCGVALMVSVLVAAVAATSFSVPDWPSLSPWIAGCAAGFVLAVTLVVFVRVSPRPKDGEATDSEPRDRTAESDTAPSHVGSQRKCAACRTAMDTARRRRSLVRSSALVFVVTALSCVAQGFRFDGAYGWPLAAACAALTGLVGLAAFEPTSLARRERRMLLLRGRHRDAVTGTSRAPSDDGRNAGSAN